MLPAFPMDGGRVLRALLSMKIKDRLVATRWAVRIGQLMALLFVLGGIYWDAYMLLFIGIFVFLTARFEYRQLKLSQAMKEASVMDIIRIDYTVLGLKDSIEKAMNIQGESNFLIADEEGNIVGSLPSVFIRKAIKENATTRSIESFMSGSYGLVSSELNLAQVFERLNRNGWAIAIVHDGEGNKKGVVDRQLLLDFINDHR